ncbi:hypothetical protein BC827DRAFT_1247398 [Russula dissimulans]|nr:hypothetical protein BC827DRAFT_1247398 [Russula dissimulans]
MILQKYTRSVDGTIPVSALLYDDEENYASQDNVGIYDGLQKSVNHQNGTISVTTHRLFYIDAAKPHSHSFHLDLSSVVRTEYYAGLFTSSPKVTIYLTPEAHLVAASGDEAGESWQCEVCDFRNPPGSSPTGAKCALCGVPRHKEVACPACTFLNHPALTQCEICGTALPQVAAPVASRAETPTPEGASDDRTVLRLSFRRGGDKALYAVLKRSLLGKAWQTKTIGQRVTPLTSERLASSAQLDMYEALMDLDALMVKAREMVRLAGELNDRLTTVTELNASAGGAEPETATFIRTSLVQLGLRMTDVPVTLDMARDEKQWYEQLARELAAVLQGTGGKNVTG